MKKLLFIFAFGALALVACNKEKEIDTPTPIAQTITLSASGEAFNELDINGATTKGTLNAAGNFLWATGDQIGVRLYKGTDYLGTWTAYGYYEARDATFTLKDGFDGQSSGEFQSNDNTANDDQYVNWGYAAFYPRFSNNINNSDGKVYFEFKKVYENYTSGTCLMPMVASLGDGGDELRPADISFKHVGAGVRVTIKNVPADANQASLTVAGKNIVNGDTNGNWYGVNPANAGTDAISATDGADDTVYLKFATASEKRDITFIFPLPTVDLSGGITLKLYYGSEHTEFWSKTAHPVAPKTPLPTLGRGDLLDMPDLTVGDWVKLGTGKFIDNFMWGKLIAESMLSNGNQGVSREIPSAVDVTIYQNSSNRKQYKVVDPYGIAATQFGYAGSTRSNELIFTLDGSYVTSFDTHTTGFVVDSGKKNIQLVYPGTLGKSTDHNIIVAGSDTNPEIVQLAPVYTAVGNTGYAYNKYDINNMIRIIFPGVSGYDCSYTSTGTSRMESLAYVKGSKVTACRLVLSAYNDVEISSNVFPSNTGGDGQKSNDYHAQGYGSNNKYPGVSGYYTSSGTNNWSDQSFDSGLLYLSWFAFNDRGVVGQGSTKVYALSTADAASFVGTYLITSYDSASSSLNSNTRKTMILNASNDCTKGNLQVGAGLGSGDGKTNALFANQKIDHMIYGVLAGTNLTLFKSASNDDQFFENVNNYFYFGQRSDSGVGTSVSDFSDATFTTSTSEGVTLQNSAFLHLYYHDGSATGTQKQWIYVENAKYTKQ